MSESPFTPFLGLAIANTRRCRREQRGPVVAQCQSPVCPCQRWQVPRRGRMGVGRTPGGPPTFASSPSASTSGLALLFPNPKPAALPPLHLSNLILENIWISKWRCEKGAGDVVDYRDGLGLCLHWCVRGDVRTPVLSVQGFFFRLCKTHPAGTRWVFALEMPEILGRIWHDTVPWVTWSWPNPSTQHPKHPCRC